MYVCNIQSVRVMLKVHAYALDVTSECGRYYVKNTFFFTTLTLYCRMS